MVVIIHCQTFNYVAMICMLNFKRDYFFHFSFLDCLPHEIFWDAQEPKLLACEIIKATPDKQQHGPGKAGGSFMRKPSNLSSQKPEEVTIMYIFTVSFELSCTE